jgi:hypothetical protein
MYAAKNGCVYMQVLQIHKSELEFLRGICRALELKSNFGRKGDAFLAAAAELKRRKSPIFIDEMDMMPQWGIELARDLTKFAQAHVVLVGEEELLTMMQRNRRVWSRTFQFMEFVPMDATDIMIYAKEATGLLLSPDVAAVFLEESDGDFRLVKRDIIKLVQYANAAGTDRVDVKMAMVAVKKGLKG